MGAGSGNIRFKPEGKKPRKAFEVPHINILWTADIMYGPYIKVGKKKMLGNVFEPAKTTDPYVLSLYRRAKYVLTCLPLSMTIHV